MHCAADRTGKRCLVSRYGKRLGACLLAICALAACSPAGSAGHAGRPGRAPPGPFGRGHFVIIRGPAGGFFAVPAAAGSNGRPKIIVPPIPAAASGETVSLPLNTYAEVAGLQQTVLAEAQALLTQKCMAARGFVYSDQPTPVEEQAVLQNIEYGFGVTSLSDAGSYGYGQPPAASAPPGGFFAGAYASFNVLNHKPVAWQLALTGFAIGARVGPARQVSCLNLAASEIYRPGSNQLGDPVPAIAQQASLWTQTDPRVLAVSAAWSRCMAQRGYHYHSAQQAAQHNWPSRPTAAETATAAADVTCKQQVNLANTWLTVEAAYQSALIGQNIGTLASLQASFTGALNRVEAVLATAAGQAPGGLGGGPAGPRPVPRAAG